MAFNLGVGSGSASAAFAMQVAYLYESVIYRRWVVDISLAFYQGRQDEFVWLDLKRQFRKPEGQQIVPYNLTQEIIDETSILYREEPIYQVKDKNTGKTLTKDQALWKRIRKDARYHNMCQQLDSMTKLLGTVLVKVSFIDPDTGDLVNANKPGVVNFELEYGGSYDVRYSASPYHLSSVEFGMVDSPSGWNFNSPSSVATLPINPDLSVAMRPGRSDKKYNRVKSIKDLKQERINKVFWSKDGHKVQDSDGNFYEGENPYGCIPAVPFFNQDPGNRYFLPVNEPLLYANHAVNMRLTDLNHVAKFQSFGQAVVKGIERPVNNRLGRPIDDMNARGGSRGTGFGFGGNVGPGGLDRNNFSPFDHYGDGNALPNMNGFSLGPDTMISVGETGDFKFEKPGADITGLTSTIYTMMDMVRINHGLQPKHNSSLPPSGAALMSAKLGVVEQNKKRQILFREREQQLFEIVKKLWNAHHDGEPGADLFSENAELDIYYVDPEFAVDPQTKAVTVKMNQEILNSGSFEAIKKIQPHLDEQAVKELVERSHKERIAQAERDAEIEAAKINKLIDLGVDFDLDKEGKPSGKPKDKSDEIDTRSTSRKIENPAKHAEQSSIQPGRNGDGRKSDKTKRAEKQKRIESGFKEE
jgi:hypothetical protein